MIQVHLHEMFNYGMQCQRVCHPDQCNPWVHQWHDYQTLKWMDHCTRNFSCCQLYCYNIYNLRSVEGRPLFDTTAHFLMLAQTKTCPIESKRTPLNGCRPWTQLDSRRGQVNEIVNEFGGRDHR